MFAAIIRIEQLPRVCAAALWDCNDTDRWGSHHRLDLVVTAEGKADLGVEEANHG